MRYIIICLLFLVYSAAYAQMSEEDSLMLADIAYWDSLEALESNYIPYKVGNSWTLFDLDSGTVNDSFQFDEWLPQGNFSDYYALKKDGWYGALSHSGDTILPFEYDTIATTVYGVIGSKGKEWYFPKFSEFEYSIDTLELDSISCKGELVYLYTKNKVGIYSYGAVTVPPVYIAVQPLLLPNWYNKSYEVILAFDGDQYRFFDYQGKDLLGTATPEFELMRDNFVRYKKNGRWWYYNFTSQNTYDSQGNDVVIYTYFKRFIRVEAIKIYGPNRSNATLHVGDKTVSGYDDYFLIGGDFLAFRNGGKVGLMEVNGTVHISPRYDKIELVDSELGYFKFFRGDSCGLVTKSGVQLFQPNYANIFSTGDPDRLLVIDNELTGVVDKRGKVIIPLKYNFIEYGNNCFFLEYGNQIGLASIDGDIIFEPQFRHYRVENGNSWEDPFYAIVFEDFSGKLLLANIRGRLTSKKFNDYNFGNQTAKLYRDNEIEVLVLDDDTEIEESVIYPNVSSLVVKKGNWDSRVRWGLGGWGRSYLEENQLNGQFGLRYFQKKGLAVEPIYKEIQSTGLEGHFGERLDEGTFQLADGIDLRRRAVYDHMYQGNAHIENKDLVSAESVAHNTSSNWSFTVVAQNKNNHGTIEVPHESMPFSFGELSEMNLTFSRQFGVNLPKMYLIDAKPVVCSIDSAEISLFEYYHYFNMLGGLRMTKESAPIIMNPNLGIRFEGGKRRVSDANSFRFGTSCLRFNPHKTFHDFRFTESGDFIFSKNLGDTALWDLRDFIWREDEKALPSRKCIDYKEIANRFETRLELKEEGTSTYIIHEDFPEFEYITSDSLPRNYYAGRLIQKNPNGFDLVDPNGTMYVSNQDRIQYLGEGFFGVKSSGIWRVLTRDGQPVIDREFTQVGKVNNGFFSANNNDLKGIYSVTGEVVVETSETLTHIEGSLYKVRELPQEVWFDAETKIYDTLLAEETYLGNRVFYRKVEDETYTLRPFGNPKAMEVASEIKPYCVQNAVVYKKKKKLFVLDANGVESTYKKASGPKEYGAFLVIDGKKNKLILNSDGKLIHTSEEDARVKTYSDDLLIKTSDTSFLVAQSGELNKVTEREQALSNAASENEMTLVKEFGKYGAVRDDEQIIPTKYDRLYYAGEGEFRATQNYVINLFDAHLEQMNGIPYHRCYFIDEDVMVFELNGEWFYYQKKEKWERIE
ncbi:MAG: hypothetical protein NXI10_02335 [bacterium]|nr:hypothetical protein [bacterium]